jgi:CheY-like chemotaxis protein
MNQHDTIQKRLALVLVEDNPGDVYLIRRALDAQGLAYDLSVASDGEEAIDYVAKCEAGSHAIDLVLLDLNLPRRGGSEVLARIRSSSRFGRVPTLLLTSSDSAQDRERCLRLGASAYIRKPSNLADFMLIGKMVKDLTGGG